MNQANKENQADHKGFYDACAQQGIGTANLSEHFTGNTLKRTPELHVEIEVSSIMFSIIATTGGVDFIRDLILNGAKEDKTAPCIRFELEIWEALRIAAEANGVDLREYLEISIKAGDLKMSKRGITITFNPELLAEVDIAAKAAGKTSAEFIRETLNFRIDESQRDLNLIANQTGVSSAKLIKSAVKQFIEKTKKTGSLTLEPEREALDQTSKKETA